MCFSQEVALREKLLFIRHPFNRSEKARKYLLMQGKYDEREALITTQPKCVLKLILF